MNRDSYNKKMKTKQSRDRNFKIQSKFRNDSN